MLWCQQMQNGPTPRCSKQMTQMSRRMSQNKLTKVKQRLKENDLTVRKKQSGGRSNYSIALTTAEEDAIVRFLCGYTGDNALVLSGRPLSFSTDDVMLLPSSHTENFVFEQYCSAERSAGIYNCCGK
ncbi:uncharacterized protein LOC106011364 [Aplysia californica]|uniref:Uncharacterized protein LOC106011364 n=1 Tax=Aplysia californica TaxID=6500 RepID=A0ABM0ZWV0_APLCA|nr:uncharacterized protein LOC106011364 [Aplysia californica]